LPAAAQERLSSAARRAADTPRFRERLEHDGLEPAPDRPLAEFAAMVRQESAFWERKVRELDLKME
jgi:tripartite-type tricarboxylate transporter receptor subunit TctC